MTEKRSTPAWWLGLALLLLLIATAFLLAGCDLPSFEPTAPPGEPTATETVSDEPTALPTEPVAPTPAPAGVITLTVWTTEAFSPTQVLTSGLILSQQVIEFEARNEDLRVEFIVKKPYGKGGILDYLLTTATVVPELLPDLAILDVEELGAAVQAGVVQPLDDLLPSELATDLYDFAREAATYDDQLMGLQFQADLDHLVYDSGRLTVPPRSWPGVLSNPGSYVFPAGGRSGLVNDSFLMQYLSVRPWPPESGVDEPFLEADSLTAVLQFYLDGITRGVIPPEILDYHTTEDSWAVYEDGEATLAQVSAHRYLAERGDLARSAVAPIPAISGAANPLSSGWALVLVATDPARQELAIELMSDLVSPEINVAWNLAADYLPTRQSALGSLDPADSYLRFVDQQLQAARPRPRIANYAQVAVLLQTAVEDVVTGAASPEEAAARAIESSP
jgi:ABC-type glycerol-3-phosphate transport system substrate-binding protein